MVNNAFTFSADQAKGRHFQVADGRASSFLPLIHHSATSWVNIILKKRTSILRHFSRDISSEDWPLHLNASVVGVIELRPFHLLCTASNHMLSSQYDAALSKVGTRISSSVASFCHSDGSHPLCVGLTLVDNTRAPLASLFGSKPSHKCLSSKKPFFLPPSFPTSKISKEVWQKREFEGDSRPF